MSFFKCKYNKYLSFVFGLLVVAPFLFLTVLPEQASAASRPVVLSPTTVDFGDVPVCIPAKPQRITIVNNDSGREGNVDVNSLSTPFKVERFGPCYGNDGKVIQGCQDPNPVLLPPNKQLAIEISFSTVTLGTFSDTLTVNQTDAQQGQDTLSRNFPVRGRVIPAVLNIDVSPNTINFGDVFVGKQGSQKITLTNQKSSTGILEGSLTISPGPFAVLSDNTFSLNPGRSKSFSLSFSPFSAGPAFGDLTITYKTISCDPNSSVLTTTVPLSGTGVPLINLFVTPTALDFGEVTLGQSVEKVITMTNLSTSTDTLTGSIGTLSSPFFLAEGGTTFSLAPKASKQLRVRFSPTSTGLPFSDILNITHNATNQASSPISIPITGIGILPVIQIAVNPSPINFGNVAVGQSANKVITITNPISSTGTLEGNVANLSNPFTLVNGGGSFSLQPGKSTQVVVNFSPPTLGSFSDNLTITHNAPNGVPGTTLSVPITGVGGPFINMSISPVPVSFGNVVVGESVTQTLTITNLSSSAGILEGNIGSLSAPFSVKSGGGTLRLTPGASLSVELAFSPTVAGVSSQALTITHNATNLVNPVDVALTGTGLATVGINVSPNPVDFGIVPLGGSATQTLRITNPSSSTGRLEGNVTNLSNPFSVVNGAGPFTLEPGDSHSVTIRFSPTSQGPTSGNLIITHNAPGGVTNIPLVVEGISLINLSVSPSPLEFGKVVVGQVVRQTLTLTNLSSSTGQLEGTVGAGGSSLLSPFSIVSGSGPFNLTPGNSLSIVITFSPTSVGTFSQILSITHNATNQSSPAQVLVRGTGVTTVNIEVRPNPLEFVPTLVGRPTSQTLTITNLSSSTNVLEGRIGSLSSPFSVVSGDIPFSLSPGKSHTVVIQFFPSSEGTFSQTLAINHNATNQSSPTIVSIKGQGMLPVNIAINPSSVDFGSILVGRSGRQSVTITNLASSAGTLMASVGSLSSPFSIASGGGSFSLEPGKSRSVVIDFSPTSLGAFSQDLLITHNATNLLGPTTLRLTGTGLFIVNLAVEPTSVNFGKVPLGQSVTQTLTFTNLSTSLNTLTGSIGTLSGNDGGSGPFSVVSGSGSFTLGPGQSQAIRVRFFPTSAGSFSETLFITYNAPGQVGTPVGTITSPSAPNSFGVPVSGMGDISVNLVVTATGSINSPSLQPGQTLVSFGNIPVGSVATQTITISNEITSAALLIGNFSDPTPPFFIVSGGGSFSLAPGSSQSVVVSFSPIFEGLFFGALPITHNATNQPDSTSGNTVLNISLSGATPVTWGVRRDIPVPQDYDGDKKADLAVWRTSIGSWHILASENPLPFAPAWGLPGDKPIPADYDKDGLADLAVFRPSDGGWFIQTSQGEIRIENFGPPLFSGLDIPVPADYDGDGKADPAVFRSFFGEWDIILSSAPQGSAPLQALWGQQKDIPLPTDYDGDGKADLAVWRPAEGTWYIAFSSGETTTIQWGLPGDTPVPADYDGDRKTDLAVWRPSDGTWYFLFSSGETGIVSWGLLGDTPVPGDYNGDGRADAAVWRPSEGKWYVLF